MTEEVACGTDYKAQFRVQRNQQDILKQEGTEQEALITPRFEGTKRKDNYHEQRDLQLELEERATKQELSR